MNLAMLSATLRDDEGFEPSVYKDHLGYWTLGYGFLVDPEKGGEIPLRIANLWLEHAIQERWERLVAARPWIVNQPEDVQQALGNMVYQLGVGGVLKFGKMLAALEDGDRELAAIESLDSKWATQTPERAERVAALIRG